MRYLKLKRKRSLNLWVRVVVMLPPLITHGPEAIITALFTAPLIVCPPKPFKATALSAFVVPISPIKVCVPMPVFVVKLRLIVFALLIVDAKESAPFAVVRKVVFPNTTTPL